MTAFSVTHLSGSTNGRPIALPTSSVAIHTATPTANEYDAVTLSVTNSSSALEELTLEIGGTGHPDIVVLQVPPKAKLSLYVGSQLLLSGGVAVTAKASTAGALAIHGAVKRINQA